MINYIKMELYRLVRTKSFYITLGTMLVFVLWIQNAEGFHINTPFASYDYRENSLPDFLYFFPKAMLLTVPVTVFLILFEGSSYEHGYVKNVYPIYTNKAALLAYKTLFSFFVTTLFLLAGICLTGIVNLWHHDSFIAFDWIPYLGYTFIQVLLITCVNAGLAMLLHVWKSKIIAIFLALAYDLMFIYMLMTLLLETLLPRGLNFASNTIYALSGSLQADSGMVVYTRTMAIAVIMIIVYNSISYYFLSRKDLV